MKKLIICCLLTALYGPVALFAHSDRKNDISIENYEKISLSDFSHLLFEGVTPDKLRGLLIECPAGTELPFKFTLKGEIFSFEPTSDVKFSIKLNKTCYLTHRPKLGLVFSTDMKNWRKFAEFFIGKASTAFVVENQIPTASFELEVNENTNRWELPFGASVPYGQRTKYTYQYRSDPYPSHSWTPTNPDQDK